MNASQQIANELDLIGAELRKPSTLPFGKMEINKFVRQLERGFVITHGDVTDRFGVSEQWRVVQFLPYGYTGVYYVAGQPFSPKHISTAQERRISESMWADQSKGYTLD